MNHKQKIINKLLPHLLAEENRYNNRGCFNINKQIAFWLEERGVNYEGKDIRQLNGLYLMYRHNHEK